MKKSIIITLSLSLALFISACGNSDAGSSTSSSSSSISSISSEQVSSSSESSVDNNITQRISIPMCSKVSDDAFTQIESGDVLINEEVNSSVKIVHNEDDTKFVCVLSGKAYLVR